MPELKFIKHVKDKGGFERPLMVYGKNHAKVEGRTFTSIGAAAVHISTLDSPIRRNKRPEYIKPNRHW